MCFGALNKETGEYVDASLANKNNKYKCPECGRDLILCKGSKIKAYFRHKASTNPCTYYSKSPGESQIHKDAKLKLKELIKRKEITFKRKCCKCYKNDDFTINSFDETTEEIVIEHNFQHNDTNKFADVARISKTDLSIIEIFEVCHTHKTNEDDRPGIWYEINAKEILENFENDNQNIILNCLRNTECKKCSYMTKLRKSNIEKWISLKLCESPYWRLKDPMPYLTIKRCCNYDEEYECMQHNKEISDIFANDLNGKRFMIYTWKRDVIAIILSKERYDKCNYRDFDFSELYRGNTPFPVSKMIWWHNSETTIDILKDIMINN